MAEQIPSLTEHSLPDFVQLDGDGAVGGTRELPTLEEHLVVNSILQHLMKLAGPQGEIPDFPAQRSLATLQSETFSSQGVEPIFLSCLQLANKVGQMGKGVYGRFSTCLPS